MSTGGECIFTINLGQSNLTISLFITSFLFTGPRKLYLSNYLKVNQVLIMIVGSKYVTNPFLLQVYDGPTVSSPLLTTLNDNFKTPYPVFSTGPSLTMAYKTINWLGLLDMSYTSTDQGRISALSALYVVPKLCILLACIEYEYRQRLRWKNVQYGWYDNESNVSYGVQQELNLQVGYRGSKTKSNHDSVWRCVR